MRKKLLLVFLLLPVVSGAAGFGYLQWRRRPRTPAPTQQRLAALRQERAALRERFRVLTSGVDDLLEFAQAPEARLLVGIPESLTRSLIEQTLTGFLGEVSLTLRNLHVQKSDEVKGKFLFGMQTFGNFDLTVDIEEVKGTLRPGKPTVRFDKERIGVDVPVRIAAGSGRAVVGLKWRSQGVADVVCGDLDVKRTLTGSVVPSDQRVAGAFEVGMEQRAVVLTPRFGEVVVRIAVTPSEESWHAVDALIEEQKGLCRSTLKKVDVKAKLAEIMAKGFDVKLPSKLFRPVRLPLGVQQSLSLQGINVSLEVQPAGLRIAKQRIWYGVNVSATRQADTTPTPSPEASRPD